MAIDFVVHGDQGVAGPWAASAKPGDELIVNGPGGAYRPDPEADWHLLVGDEAAIPAISAALAELAELRVDARAVVIIQVESPEHEPELITVAEADLRFLYRARGTAGHLAQAVRELEWPAGRVHAFVHGEAEEVMHGIRPYLFKEKGLERAQVSISGYWRLGGTEEAFRAWKSELARKEQGPN